jgi:hypothetical protein
VPWNSALAQELHLSYHRGISHSIILAACQSVYPNGEKSGRSGRTSRDFVERLERQGTNSVEWLTELRANASRIGSATKMHDPEGWRKSQVSHAFA